MTPTPIGLRRMRYPGNDPENGPACWHVWTGERWAVEACAFDHIAAYYEAKGDDDRSAFYWHKGIA